MEIPVRSSGREELIDITEQVRRAVDIESGLCVVYCPHTTAGLTINEGADPSVRLDVLDALKRLVPDGAGYRHREGNSPAHVKASLMGSSLVILVEGGRLRLGTWQSIFFCEFDGPRDRRVFVKTVEG
ncbi:MAG: YjbQ family protein [Methanobacteriota archaeon]|nr:MAG: YjbQ family protein [Euryarchaeota archaeon]